MRDVWKGTQDVTAIIAVVLLGVTAVGLLFGAISLKKAKQLMGIVLVFAAACVFLDGRTK